MHYLVFVTSPYFGRWDPTFQIRKRKSNWIEVIWFPQQAILSLCTSMSFFCIGLVRGYSAPAIPSIHDCDPYLLPTKDIASWTSNDIHSTSISSPFNYYYLYVRFLCRFDTADWCILRKSFRWLSAPLFRQKEYHNCIITISNHRLGTNCHSNPLWTHHARSFHYWLLCRPMPSIGTNLCNNKKYSKIPSE